MKKIFCIPGGGDVILFGKRVDSGVFFAFGLAFLIVCFYILLGIVFH